MSLASERQVGKPISCKNLNHRRADAAVAHCPDCGSVVNASRRRLRCPDIEHDTARRQRSAYCVHCGTQLIGRYR